jgi:hypothetical protein
VYLERRSYHEIAQSLKQFAKCQKNSAQVQEKNEVVPFIWKYVKHLKPLCADATAVGYRRRFPAIAYWRGVAELLEGEFGSDNNAKGFQARELYLSLDFWPRTNHETGFNRSLPQNAPSSLLPDGATGILEAEWAEEVEDKNTIFIGNVNEKEKKAWTPLEGIKSG